MTRRHWPGWLVLVALLWTWPALATADDEAPDAQEAVTDQSEDESAEAEDGNGDEVAEEQSEGGEADEADETDEEVVGPGGQPLRTDYPGTDDALQQRMETGEIEQVDIADEQDPAEVYDLRVRELETQLDDLQEDVFRSRSRIALLRETVLAENLAGSRAIVTFQNDLGAAYNIERAIFSVDGSQVYSQADPSGRIDGDGVEVFSGPMAPGTHTVSVTLGLRGSGYGIFRYAEGYEFDLRFSCQFTAEEGRTTLVTVQTYESGNVFTAHEDRPDGLCEVSMVELTVGEMEDDVGDEIEDDLLDEELDSDVDLEQELP